MAEIRVTKVEQQGQTKFKNVPIAVTPEGFWCCPSPVVFQKASKPNNSLNKLKPSQKTQTPTPEKKPIPQHRPSVVSEEPNVSVPVETDQTPHPNIMNVPKKVSIEFGESGSSDVRVVLIGKQGLAVKLNVHRDILAENSMFFASKIMSGQEPVHPCVIEVDDCDDVEIYVETVGLMYCSDLRQRLIKQSVSRVLRILKVAEHIGFRTCMQSCLKYLEAIPWVGEEEEQKVVASVLRLRGEGMGVNPVLKRVLPEISKPPKDTLAHILTLVLNSDVEIGRREMKSIVLKLLRENNDTLPNEILYSSCRSCLGLLLDLFRQEEDEPDGKKIALHADNLTWMFEMLIDRQSGDGFTEMWASQDEMASLHAKLPTVVRHHVSFITGRVFVGIGRGEVLPCKETRQRLLETWLEPLMKDYRWLQHGSCRSFDRKVVEEGIGRTILTLPLEEQQRVLLVWLDWFLKAGDNCPNLQRAFEVWWRRTFIRPFTDSQSMEASSAPAASDALLSVVSEN
ncbi:unnamed protein product [Cuscuta epithymum]|uniref:BTB domain-containing protein n=1 Tax=Cuscuta epithymum TaxID=186058 RepID=A0AAV0DII2_9ASTE|nr:unnamed protein product [Cuscuta epithymum]